MVGRPYSTPVFPIFWLRCQIPSPIPALRRSLFRGPSPPCRFGGLLWREKRELSSGCFSLSLEPLDCSREVIFICEVAVDAGEADVRDPVELPESVHCQFAD